MNASESKMKNRNRMAFGVRMDVRSLLFRANHIRGCATPSQVPLKLWNRRAGRRTRRGQRIGVGEWWLRVRKRIWCRGRRLGVGIGSRAKQIWLMMIHRLLCPLNIPVASRQLPSNIAPGRCRSLKRTETVRLHRFHQKSHHFVDAKIVHENIDVRPSRDGLAASFGGSIVGRELSRRGISAQGCHGSCDAVLSNLRALLLTIGPSIFQPG